MKRVLRVCFQQSLRSATLFGLPLAFLSLIGWATAGSATGQTSDPIRAAVWLWLAAHHIPFNIHFQSDSSNALLSYLPIGAMLFPYLAIRVGIRRCIEKIQPTQNHIIRQVIFGFALSYSFIAAIAAVIASSGSIKIHWYLAFPIVFAFTWITAFATAILEPGKFTDFFWRKTIRTSLVGILIIWGIGAIALSVSILLHLSVINQLTTVIQPGIFGGLALLLIQVLYIPNAAFAAVGYFTGAGLQIGNGSLIHPLVHRLSEIPAIPLLGALPVNVFPIAILGSLLPVIFGIWASKSADLRYRISLIGSLAFLTFAISLLSSGALLNRNLSYIGLSWWQFPLLITAEFAIGVGISILIEKRKKING